MPTELERLRAIRRDAKRDLDAFLTRREREQAQALCEAKPSDFPDPVCGVCGKNLPSKTPVAPGVVPLCRECRTPNTGDAL